MNLYEVVRYGNEEEAEILGSNGLDTCFLVRAATHQEAASLVEPFLARKPHKELKTYADLVHWLGVESSAESDPRILRGPYLQAAYTYGWKSWWRQEKNESWTEKNG